jgi:predicted nucleic acid-binding protein
VSFSEASRQSLFVDTGAWYAYVNRRDPQHETVVALLDRFEGRLWTSNFIFGEAVTLCLVRQGHGLAARLGEVLRDALQVHLIRVTAVDEEGAWELFRARPDKRYSFTDCTSFVLLRRLPPMQVAALDDHFRQEGFSIEPG